jgi:hypothetical protein
MGGKTYQPKDDAVVIASQNRKALVGMLPAADRSARCGGRAEGIMR